jgi:hypothetical protein
MHFSADRRKKLRKFAINRNSSPNKVAPSIEQRFFCFCREARETYSRFVLNEIFVGLLVMKLTNEKQTNLFYGEGNDT